MLTRRARVYGLLFSLMTAYPTVLRAAPGDLDPDFGSGGIVTTVIGGSSTANALVMQPDGKIVAAGTSYSQPPSDFTLVRYESDGTVDRTFGTGGVATTDFDDNEDVALALALQPDGKLVAAGFTYDGSVTRFALSRYDTNGSPDGAFGIGGKVVTDFGGDVAFDVAVAYGVVIQPDGKIVVAGFSSTPGAPPHAPNWNFAIARYDSDGNLDPTFGMSGKVTTDFAGDDDTGRAVLIQPDAKIVVAGDALAGSTDFDAALVRYETDGTLDPTFGTLGKVAMDFGD